MDISLVFLRYDFIGNSLVKVYTTSTLDSNHHFTKMFGLNHATHLNPTFEFRFAIDAFNGNFVASFSIMVAGDVQTYALTLYEEFTKVDSILPFTQIPADLAATCTA